MGDASQRRGARPIPNDLVESILRRLSGISMHRLKYVCKWWWRNMVNSFSFPWGSSDIVGLVLQNGVDWNKVKYIALEPKHSNIKLSNADDSILMEIVQCCCGFLLNTVTFIQQRADDSSDKKYCVSNPTTRQRIDFSIPLKLVKGYRNEDVTGALLYDTKTPKRFDVVFMHTFQREGVSGGRWRLIYMQMYSLDTGVLSNLCRPVLIDMNRGEIEASVTFSSAFSWNKCLFSIKKNCRKLFYYDIEARMFRDMNIPNPAEQTRREINYVGVGEDDDTVYLIESYQSDNLYIYEAKSLNFEWVLRYQIDISNISALFTPILYHGIYKKDGKAILVATTRWDGVIKYNLDIPSYVTVDKYSTRVFSKSFLCKENKNWIPCGATQEQTSQLPVTM